MRKNLWMWAAAVSLVTAIGFVPAIRCGFVNIDDPNYVLRNPLVLGGLSSDGIRHACTDIVFHNWAPLTILSLQIDTSLFGTAPWGYHLSNIIIHSATAGVLFLALARMTGAISPSAASSLLFALHPLRVESVAWIAERKDVLSLFFVAVALLAYDRYCRSPTRARYAAVAAAMLASLLAKATAVTLPALLLLLDVWPLGRADVLWCRSPKDEGTASPKSTTASWRRCIIEKVPLFLMAAGFTGLTIWTNTAAMQAEGKYPLITVRIPHAVTATAAYLRETFIPLGLHPVHEHVGDAISESAVLISAAVIVLVVGLAWVLRRNMPACAAGLVWFFIALAPVCGIVTQLGFASRADRFTYMPHIGLMVAIVWTGWWIIERLGLGRTAALASVAAATTGCILLDWRQIAIWHDSLSLWNHVIAHEPKSALAHMCLGQELHDRGDLDGAEVALRRSVMIKDNKWTRDWLGLVLAAKGRVAEAYEEHDAATRLDPGLWEAHNNAGIALARMGKMQEALERFERAANFAADDHDVLMNIARARAELARAAGTTRD